jgi:hypothetical protein
MSFIKMEFGGFRRISTTNYISPNLLVPQLFVALVRVMHIHLVPDILTWPMVRFGFELND